ncbi:ATP synthase subunit A [Flavobacterium columnare]|nr:ATP synthase subunit A [Flavobacterium columnare]
MLHRVTPSKALSFTKFDACYLLLFTLYSLLFTLYSLLFTLYSLLFTLYSLLFTLYSSLFTLYFFTQHSLILNHQSVTYISPHLSTLHRFQIYY